MKALPIYKRVIAFMQRQRGGKAGYSAIRDAAGCEESSLCRALRSLESGGYVTNPTRGKYALTKKGKATQPEHVIDARVVDNRANAETGGIREKFWRYLRNQRVVSAEQAVPLLVDAGKVTPHTYQDVNRYCAALEAAGYIVALPNQKTKVSRRIRWRLERDTGLHSPKMERDRKTLIDRNTGDVWNL